MIYTLFNREGKKIEEFHFLAPYCGLCHDIGITPNFVIFQMYPLACDAERLKSGGNHWVRTTSRLARVMLIEFFQVYDETISMHLCLLPRRAPKTEDVKWFTWKPDYFQGV